MLKLAISADTETWTTRDPDPEDGWDQGDTAGRVTNVTAFLDKYGSVYYSSGDSITKELDVEIGGTIYVVVADYESGSTFGRSGGHAQVLDAFTTLDEAEALSKAADYPCNGNFQHDYSFTHNGTEYSRSWVGYFESLNALQVWSVTVREHRDDPYGPPSGRHSHQI